MLVPRVLACFLLFSVAFTAFFRTTQAGDEPAAKLPPEKKQPQVINMLEGKNAKLWRVIDKFDFEDHGKVEIKDNQVILNRGEPATGIAWQGELPRINYELTLEARRIEGSDFFCGITFPIEKAYASLILGGWGGGVTGLSNVDGLSAVENETTNYIEFKQNQWYKVRLRVTPKKVEAWVGDEQIVDLAVADKKFAIWWEQEPARPLGIVTWNTKGGLRKISLKRL